MMPGAGSKEHGAEADNSNLLPAPRSVLPREVKFSNLDKIFWPDEGITKGDLIDYYRGVAEVLVPHLKARPFTMRRYGGATCQP